MEKVIHRSESRGFADHGWLRTFYTFSYGSYYDPRRINFGAIRVINDDEVLGGEGFSSHPHDNIEIVYIPLEGMLEHGDNMGNIISVGKGDVQVISSGTGIVHNEYNKSLTDPAKYIMVWVFPREYDLAPAYMKARMPEPVDNQFRLFVSPEGGENGVSINQDAWFHLATIEEGRELVYTLHNSDQDGVYVFVVEGDIEIDGTALGERDGIGITGTDYVTIKALSQANILLIEIKMKR